MKKKRIIFYIILIFLIFCFYMISADNKPQKENNKIKTDFSKIEELYLIYPEGIKDIEREVYYEYHHQLSFPRTVSGFCQLPY